MAGVLIVSLKYSPVHHRHCRALGEPLRTIGAVTNQTASFYATVLARRHGLDNANKTERDNCHYPDIQ